MLVATLARPISTDLVRPKECKAIAAFDVLWYKKKSKDR